MFDTVTRYLEGLSSFKDANFLRSIFSPIADRYSSQPMTSAGLVIKAGGSALAKTGSNDFYASVKGILVKISASTDMPALTGINFSAGQFTVVCFFIDSAGTVTAAGGTAGATLGAVKWPQFPVNKALVGILIITYASAFTGGTTPLDTATTVYINPTGAAFDPSVLI